MTFINNLTRRFATTIIKQINGVHQASNQWLPLRVNFGTFAMSRSTTSSMQGNHHGSGFLVTSSPAAVLVPVRGMKYKGRVKRRCKDCEMVWQDGNLYNFCKTFPRHKQMLKPRYWQNERILTHWQNSPRRPW